jgi:hypothetical protein
MTGINVAEFISHTKAATEWFNKLTAKQKSYAVNYFIGGLVGSISLGTRTLADEVCCTFALQEMTRAIKAASEQPVTEKIEYVAISAINGNRRGAGNNP